MTFKTAFVKKANTVWRESHSRENSQEVCPVGYPTRTQEESDPPLSLRLDRLEMCSDLVKGGLMGESGDWPNSNAPPSFLSARRLLGERHHGQRIS